MNGKELIFKISKARKELSKPKETYLLMNNEDYKKAFHNKKEFIKRITLK